MATIRPSAVRRLCVVGSVAAFALTAAACSVGTSTNTAGSGSSSSSKSDYVIGYTNGISGVGAAIAKGEINGLNAAFNAQNAQGGVNGHKLKLVTLDSQDAPATGASNVTQLVKSDGAIAVLGLVGSPACTPTVRLSATYQVPIVCGVADTSDLKPAKPYLYTKYGSEVTEAKAMIDVVKTKIKKKNPKLGFVFIDFPSAREWANTVKKQAAAAGFQTVAFDGITATSVDLGTEAARLKSAGTDVVLTQIISPQVISLDRAIKSQGSSMSIITEATTADYPTLKQLADPNIYQLMLTPIVDPADTAPAVQAYVKAVGSLGISGKDGINGTDLEISYSQGMHIIEALKHCGDNCTGATLNQALQSVTLNLAGINQDYSYTSDRHYPQTTFTVAVYDAAKGDVVNDPTVYQGNPIP
ncbi:MAG: ABC transporter substrate-binding protein [Marmoricola sp.]